MPRRAITMRDMDVEGKGVGEEGGRSAGSLPRLLMAPLYPFL